MLTIDARMIGHSGIGTYLRQVLPGICSRKDLRVHLLGDRDLLQSAGLLELNLDGFSHTSCPIYGVREQMEIPPLVRPESRLLWIPHLNIPLLAKQRLLVTIHDLFWAESWAPFLKKSYVQLMLWKMKLQADRIITVSEFSRSRLQAFAGIDLALRTTVIPHGISQNWLDFKKGARPHVNKYLLYVGNIKPHKNLKTLLRAYLDLKPDVDLVLLGRKDGFITGDQEVQNMALNQPRIHFTGEMRLDDAALSRYYAHAEALVFPSLYEGFGLPPLEAMACGCPCLLSDIPVLREQYQGSALFYSSPENVGALRQALQRILRDQDLRANLVTAGKLRALQRSVNEVTQDHLDLILPLLHS